MRARLAAPVLLCLALAAAVAVTGCGGATATGLTGQSISLEQLTRSAGASTKATSGHFAFSARTELPGARAPLAFSGEGAFDARTGRASFSVDLSAFAKLLGGFVSAFDSRAAKAPSLGDPKAWKLDVVRVGKVGYVRFPALADELPAGRSWIRSNGKTVRVGGFELSQLQPYPGTDPRSLLDVLKAASGTVETVGTEELRGEQVTHYRATIDPRAYAKVAASGSAQAPPALASQLVTGSKLGPVPVDVWLDGDRRVRKLALSFAEGQGTSTAARASTTLELWDYGDDVGIEVLPADEVVDASALHR